MEDKRKIKDSEFEEEEFDLEPVDTGGKLKERLFFGLVIVLVGSASFGVGRYSFYRNTKTPVEISYPTIDTQPTILGVTSELESKPAVGESGVVVGSKNSDKYHFPWCPGARNISLENKVTFTSTEEARAAGYKPAANCKGLE